MLIGYKISQNCIVLRETDHNTLQIKPWKECLHSDASEAIFLKCCTLTKGFLILSAILMRRKIHIKMRIFFFQLKRTVDENDEKAIKSF